MVILFEVVVICTYMINGLLGMGLMGAYVLWNWMRKKWNDEQLLSLMIIALPMAYIGVAGMTMHQLLSWYNFFLLTWICRLVKRGKGVLPISKMAMVGLITMFVLLALNFMWAKDIRGTLAEVAQIFAMIIPICIVHEYRTVIPITEKNAKALLFLYSDICVATAISMLIQYFLYMNTGTRIGFIHLTAGRRVSCYCLFKGASILSIFMGVGFVVLFIDMLQKRLTRLNLLKGSAIFAAIVLNSSRTALFMLIVVLAWLIIRRMIEKPSFKAVFITGVGFIIAVAGINYITLLRSGLEGFLDANGRTITWINGFLIWTDNIKNFLIGEGFSGGMWVGVTKTHNFVLQTLAQCGVIITIIVCALLGKLLIDNQNNKYKYTLWFVLLAGLLVTDFYANAFATVIFVLVDIYGAKERPRKLTVNYTNCKAIAQP